MEGVIARVAGSSDQPGGTAKPQEVYVHLRLPSAHRASCPGNSPLTLNPEQPESASTKPKPVQAHHIIFSKNKVSDMKTALLHGAFFFSLLWLLFKICAGSPQITIHCSKTINRDLEFPVFTSLWLYKFYSF